MTGWDAFVHRRVVASSLAIALGWVGLGCSEKEDGGAGDGGGGGAGGSSGQMGGSAGASSGGASGSGAVGGGGQGATTNYDWGPDTSPSVPPCVHSQFETEQAGTHETSYLYKSAGTGVRAVGMTDAHVYFVDGGNLSRVSFDGALEALGPFDFDLVDQNQITVRGDRLHWARALSGAEPVDIMTAEVTAPGLQTTLLEGRPQLRNFVVDDEASYWWEYDTRTIYRLSHAGGDAQTLLADVIPNGLLSHGGFLYYVDSSLFRVAVSGGEPEMLLYDGGFEAEFTADGADLYWADDNFNMINAYTPGAQRKLGLASLLGGGPGQPRVHAGQVYFTNSSDCSRLLTANKNVNAELEYEVVVQGFRLAHVQGVTATHVFLTGSDGVYKVAR